VVVSCWVHSSDGPSVAIIEAHLHPRPFMFTQNRNSPMLHLILRLLSDTQARQKRGIILVLPTALGRILVTHREAGLLCPGSGLAAIGYLHIVRGCRKINKAREVSARQAMGYRYLASGKTPTVIALCLVPVSPLNLLNHSTGFPHSLITSYLI
jgi:hypothetical protein